MSQKVAVIASVLKPVDDTRLYEKLGQSIGQTTKYRVNIIGFKSKNIQVDSNIDFHPIFSFKRVSWARLCAPWRLLILLLKLRPHLIIVSTPELLPVASFYSWFRTTTLWYDVQENYRRNVQHQSAYPKILKPIMLLWLWFTENVTRPFIDHYLLAEVGYSQEMSFPKERYSVLANKFKGALTPPKPERSLPGHFVFTGTLSPGYGLLESITLIKDWHTLGHPVSLTIIGQIHQDTFLHEIKRALDQVDEQVIHLIYDFDPVPHQQIMEVLQKADFGMVGHQPNASNENCIPTRIYEFLGLGIPFLLQNHPLWEAIAAPYQAALVVDFTALHPAELWLQLQETTFYRSNPGLEVTWSSEADKLHQLLSE